MTRMEALERVAKAAEEAAAGYYLAEDCHGQPGPLNRLASALAALRALPEPTAEGEAVEVLADVWISFGGNVKIREAGAWSGLQHGYELVATLTARVPLPKIPTIPATVEPAP